MSRYEERVRDLIGREAADWFIANREGLRSKERERFHQWLKTSPVHVEEYLGIAVLSRDLREACTDSEQDIEAVIARARLEQDETVQPLQPASVARGHNVAFGRLQTAFAMATSLAVLGLIILAFWSYRPISRHTKDTHTALQQYRTRHGELVTRRLADNSVLQLNTDSAVTVHYDGSERLVLLDFGEAVFEVARESNRPFLVRAGSAEIRVLGTKFDVRLDGDAAVITLLEGRVAVGHPAPAGASNAGAGKPFLQLVAGQQVRLAGGETVPDPTTVDTQRTVAWLRRQIMFEHEPLERVANEFNRYIRLPIQIASPALRNLEISGVFATDDAEAFIAFLRSLDHVRVEVTPTQIRVSQD